MALGNARMDAIWRSFSEWCAAENRTAMPAETETVRAFLDHDDASEVTRRRRVRAIDLAHQAAGFEVIAGPLLRASRPPRHNPAQVAKAIAACPIGDWPNGAVGRRDAAILALVGVAQWTREQVAALTADAIKVENVHSTLPKRGEPGSCPACALSRWLRCLVMAEFAACGWREVRVQLEKLGDVPPGWDTEGHICTIPPPQGHAQSGAPAFMPVDRTGNVESYYLSVTAISNIVSARLAFADAPVFVPLSVRPWTTEDRHRAWAERARGIHRLDAVTAPLDDAEAEYDTTIERMLAALAERGIAA